MQNGSSWNQDVQFAAEMHSDCRARLLSRSTFNFLESRTERGSFVGSNNAKGWHDIGLGSSGAVAVIEFGNIQRISEMFDLARLKIGSFKRLVETWTHLLVQKPPPCRCLILCWGNSWWAKNAMLVFTRSGGSLSLSHISERQKRLLVFFAIYVIIGNY